MNNKQKKCLYFSIGLICLALIGCNREQSQSDSNETAKHGKVDKYEISTNERNVLKAFLYEEMKVYISGGDVAFPELNKTLLGNYLAVSANELQNEYERNEVAGDMKFRKKLLLINGTVASIDRSVGENYYLSLKGGSNPYMQPKAAMADGYTDFLAKLNKGDKVQMICKGNGMLMGSAMLSNCEPSHRYAENIANNFIENININDAIEKKENSLKLILIGLAASSMLPSTSVCFSEKLDVEKCMAEIAPLFENEKDTGQAIEKIQARLGLQKKPVKEMKDKAESEKAAK